MRKKRMMMMIQVMIQVKEMRKKMMKKRNRKRKICVHAVANKIHVWICE